MGISIFAADGADERIPVDTFAVVVAAWAELVRRVTLEESGARPLVQWVVQGLSTGSVHLNEAPVLIGRSDDERDAAENVAAAVPRIVGEGLERIENGEDPRPSSPRRLPSKPLLWSVRFSTSDMRESLCERRNEKSR